MRPFIFSVICFGWMAVYLRACRARRYTNAFFYKFIAGLCFILIGFSLRGASRYGTLICTGLCFGLLGDQLLALRLLWKKHFTLMFALGGAAFAVGHVCYILAVTQRQVKALPAVIAFILLFSISFQYLRRKRMNMRKLQAGGYGYIGLVALMAALAISSAFCWGGKQFSMALGGISFLISDNLLLAYYYGRAEGNYMDAAIHISYYLAQILIALSI